MDEGSVQEPRSLHADAVEARAGCGSIAMGEVSGANPAAINGLRLALSGDDGAVVYVNGVEIEFLPLGRVH